MKKLLILAFILFATNVFGATYYVSTTGNDSNGCTNATTDACLTPVYAASKTTSSGDNLYFLAGTYDVTTSTDSRSAAIYPRANNVTFKPYPVGASVTLRGCTGGANCGVAPTNGVIGVDSYSNTTIDGFTIQGIVMLDGTGNNNTVQNCDISVGVDSWSGNGQGGVVWIQGGQSYFTIKNNKIHDNGVPDSGGLNATMVFCYVGSYGTIENNEIYNGTGPGIGLKDTCTNTIIRKNFIHDNALSGYWSANQGDAHDNSIYQNIFYHNNTTSEEDNCGLLLLVHARETQIYNNTFHGNYGCDIAMKYSGTGNVINTTIFNNVSSEPLSATNMAGWHIAMRYSTSWGPIAYIDYNNYYNDVAWENLYGASDSSTLSAWQGVLTDGSVSGADTNSIATDPGFLNASGTYTLASDFKRSSYTANGRGGAYPSVMGAYITGNECIGYGCSLSVPTATGCTISGASMQ
jgi:parallel beta-helix repeat protein